MTRNTERRVEVACPILDPALKEKIHIMLETMWLDNARAWELYQDGSYVQRKHSGTDIEVNSHEIFTNDARSEASETTGTPIKNGNGGFSFLRRAVQFVKNLFAG
jgi:polyphosphate kinase